MALALIDAGFPGLLAQGLIDAGRVGTGWSGVIDGSGDAEWIDPGTGAGGSTPPPAPPAERQYLTLELIDANGLTWDLARGPVRMTTAGLQGLGLPPVAFQTSESPGVDGQRLVSWRVKARDVFLPVRFKGAATTDTTGLQRRFWDGLPIGEYVTFRVTDRDGAERSLSMRLKDDGGVAYKIQPDLFQPDAIGLTFTADDPYWYGPEIPSLFVFQDGDEGDFFGGDDGAPDFHISAGSGSSGTFKLANPGDVPAWLTWEIMGNPASSFSIDVGGHLIAADSVPVTDSGLLVVSTDPRRQTAKLNGVRVPFRSFDSIDFAPIPRGGAQPVTLGLTGSGSIRAAFRPRYNRGF